ncbi:MAG: response regulator transcription factor [Candidatus Hydrothermarchaeales archaeon]
MSKIMVVDDEELVRSILKFLLEKEGYAVVEASDGEECLDKVAAERPDLILLDIMLPGIDGWEVCKKIKEDEETKDIPVIVLTVRTSDADKLKSLRYSHADVHIDKPYDNEELLGTIEMFLKSRKKRE